MSQYEDYSRIAGHYDTTRSAIGSEIWLGHLVSQFGEFSGVRVLDAGCGTGNYALVLARHVGHVTALDINERMLAEAHAKAVAAQLGDRIEFRSGELLDLPFDAGSFNAVMFNQVLHHLEQLDESGFERHRSAISEAARVLRKGGIILINACSRAQMQRGFWYHALIPGANRRGLDRTIGSQDLEDALRAAGFGAVSRTVPLDAVLQGEASFNPCGPLDATWRAGDSIWAFASDEELISALARVKEMERTGSLEAFMHEHDCDRRCIGQTTFWYAVKEA